MIAPMIKTSCIKRSSETPETRNGNVKRYNARLAACCNEKSEYYKNSSFSMKNSTIAKLLVRTSLQNGTARHLHFENSFLNGYLDPPSYTKPPRCVQSESFRNKRVMMFNRSLRDVEEPANSGNNLLFKAFREIRLK